MSEMTGATRLRLFPIMVTGGPDRYLVIRRDTGKILQTTASGIESIKLLRKGLTVDATRAAIGVKYGCAAVDVDIMPLLESLIAADFVEAIDGRTISVRQRHGVWASWRRYGAYRLAQIAMTLVRRAPIGVSTRLVLRRRPSRDPVVVEQVARNMRRVPALARAADDIERQAAENGAVLRGFFLERLLLAGLPPATLDRWLRTRARVDGLAHLDRAVARGQGVILCGFHVASYSMIPFILACRGYAQTVLMDATDDSAREIRGRIAQIRDAGYAYEIEPVAAERGARTILRGVQHGAIVLLLFDATVKPSREHAKVPFLGASLRVARGVAWLASRTSAPVLPVSIRGEGTGRYCLEIREPLTELERSTEYTTLAALARVLERDVLDQPAAWLKWKDLHIIAEHESWHDEPGGNDG